jgi:hypothetical protein
MSDTPEDPPFPRETPFPAEIPPQPPVPLDEGSGSQASTEPATPASDSPAPSAQAPSPEVGSLLSLTEARFARAGRRQTKKLFKYGCFGLVASVAYFLYAYSSDNPLHLGLGLTIYVLAVIPSLIWAEQARYGLPLFEAFMLPGINTYAIPLIAGHKSLFAYDESVILLAAVAVIVFQVVATLTYYGVKTKPKRGPLWRKEIMSRDISRLLSYGMIVTTIYTFVVTFTDWIPYVIVPEIRAAVYGIGIIATFIQCRRWGQGDLPYYDKIIFSAQLFIQVILNWVSLFLVQGVATLLLALIAYVSGSKRIPFVLVVIAAPIIAILFNGKGTMRVKYWEDRAPAPTVTELPSFFSEWFADGVAVGQETEGPAKSEGVLDRTSLIQMMCLVASISPDQKPYLMGETYTDVPGQLVPRIFWPNKPLGHVSTYKLSVYYGLQTEEETVGTTIGFGMLPEAYANFGLIGMAGLAVALGLFFNKSSNWCAESPIFSYPGLFTVVLMAWTFQTELPMSAWLASLIQACEAVIGIPFVLKFVM